MNKENTFSINVKMNLKDLRIGDRSPMFLAKKHLHSAMKEIYKLIFFAIQGNSNCS